MYACVCVHVLNTQSKVLVLSCAVICPLCATDPITLTSDAMTELEHNENDQVTLRCLFFKDQDDPDPFPQVAWNGPGVDITRNAFQTVSNIYVSTFTFTATRWYHGQFSCSVNDDGVGTISATFQLTVYCELA